jgi:hypothetical protein
MSGDDDDALLVVTIGCDDVVWRKLDAFIVVVVVVLIEQCREYYSNAVYLLNDDVYVPLGLLVLGSTSCKGKRRPRIMCHPHGITTKMHNARWG